MDRAAVMNRWRGAFLALPTSYHDDLTIDRIERFCRIPRLVSVKLATPAMKSYQSFIL